MEKYIETPTVGEILYDEFMQPFGLSSYKLAQAIHVPISRIQEILSGKRRISVDTSLRLGRYFGVSEKYFLNIQNDIDLRNTKHAHEAELIQIVPFQHKLMQM